MSTNAISSSSNPYKTSEMQNIFLQIRKNVEQLGEALQSGDLRGAQKAFSSLQQLLPVSSVNQAQTGQQTTDENIFIIDFNVLSQTLQSGDLSKAQKAFAKLQQDVQSVNKGHDRHHHNKMDDSQNSVSSSNIISC